MDDTLEDLLARRRCCATYPFVGIPGVLVFLACLGIILGLLVHVVAGMVLLGVALLGATMFGGFLATLLAMGSPSCRDEGPNDAVAQTIPSPTAPFPADVLPWQTTGGKEGAVLMSYAPGRKRKGVQRDVALDVANIHAAHHVDMVVTLLEDRELRVMACEGLGRAVMQHGMHWVHHPWRDKWLPRDTAGFVALVVELRDALDKGGRILVHCNGGKGRTGTLVAAMLLASGKERSVGKAITRMRAVRTGMLKNPLQQLYLSHLTSLQSLAEWNRE